MIFGLVRTDTSVHKQEGISFLLIASGWHTCCLMMRMVVDGMMCSASSMGSPGLDGLRWRHPLRGGDLLKLH